MRTIEEEFDEYAKERYKGEDVEYASQCKELDCLPFYKGVEVGEKIVKVKLNEALQILADILANEDVRCRVNPDKNWCSAHAQQYPAGTTCPMGRARDFYVKEKFKTGETT